MRAEMGPSAARHSALADSLGFLDMRVQDCKAELLASTVANIGPFLEDEFSVDAQPMKLHMSNITITMKVSCWYSLDLGTTNFDIVGYKMLGENAFYNIVYGGLDCSYVTATKLKDLDHCFLSF